MEIETIVTIVRSHIILKIFFHHSPQADVILDNLLLLDSNSTNSASMDTYDDRKKQQRSPTTHSRGGSVAQKMTKAATTAVAEKEVSIQNVSELGYAIAAKYVVMLKNEMREFHKPFTAPRECSGIASCASCRTHKSNNHKPAREATTADINTMALTYDKPTSRKTKLLAARTTRQH